MKRAPVLIAGPTASGKSALALALAERLSGCVINADALQVYAEWRVLTARPTPQDEARAPHRLYGHVAADKPYSVGLWLDELAAVLKECAETGLRPIVVGGSGLYFKALTEGLMAAAPPSPEIRAGAEERLAALGRDGFAAELRARDPATAARIDLANPARLLRAWEALETTGEGLATLWARTPPPLIAPETAVKLALTPPRAALYARCDARFDAMLAQGALEEARDVAQLGLPLNAPALKALGARELLAHLRGEITREAAATQARLATRRYAKRQLTWTRNQMIAWNLISAQESFKILDSATEILAEAG